MELYHALQQKLEAALLQEKHLTCHGVMADLTGILSDLEQREIEPDAFLDLLERLDIMLQRDTCVFNQFRSLKGELLLRLEKKFGLVTPNYYRNRWIGLGMFTFGALIGFLFAFALDNMAFYGIGLPIGSFIGIVYGKRKDKQAQLAGKVIRLRQTT